MAFSQYRPAKIDSRLKVVTLSLVVWLGRLWDERGQLCNARRRIVFEQRRDIDGSHPNTGFRGEDIGCPTRFSCLPQATSIGHHRQIEFILTSITRGSAD